MSVQLRSGESQDSLLKRFRKEIRPRKIRYFLAGEYGDESWRPHYHALIFGYDFPDKFRVQAQETGNPYYLSPQLTKLWPFGNHIICDLNYDAAAYVARYTTKKITGEKADSHYNRLLIDFDEVTGELHSFMETQLEPEFATMSRRPGIAESWWKKFKADCDSGYLIKDGNKIPIPKYYDYLLEKEEPTKLAAQKMERKLKAMNNPDNTPERLLDRERCKINQNKTLRRSKI